MDVMAKCPHCGQEKPMYVMHANIPATNPMKKFGQHWIKAVWHVVPDQPIEVVYTRGCPRDAGKLEIIRCRHCGEPLGDQTPPEMTEVMTNLISRIRVQSDVETIKLLKDLQANSSVTAPTPNLTVQLPNGLTTTTDDLFGYLQTTRDAKLKTSWVPDEAEDHPQKAFEQDDWRSLLNFIHQAESLNTTKWPKPSSKQHDEHDAENLGLVVSEILPNGKYRSVTSFSVLRDPGITKEVRWSICASAYLWKLNYPERKFLIRQVDDLHAAI